LQYLKNALQFPDGAFCANLLQHKNNYHKEVIVCGLRNSFTWSVIPAEAGIQKKQELDSAASAE